MRLKPTQNDYITYLEFITEEIFGVKKVNIKQTIIIKLNLLVRCRIGEITESDYKEMTQFVCNSK